MPGNEQEIDEVVLRSVRSGLQGRELIKEAAISLHCSPGIVRRFLQDRYPGLLASRLKERARGQEESLLTGLPRERVPTKHGDVYRLASTKRQGGHTF